MSLFIELKRRNVFRAAAFYAASAWLLVQIATQVFPVFSIPDWVVRAIVLAATIGFPFALLFSWFYEWTPQGIQRESEVAPNESVTRQTGRRLDHWIIATLLLAVVLLLTRLVLRPNEKPAGTTAIPEKSVAVLPFANEGGDKGQEYFSDGLADGFITALSQFAGLKVTSRQSAFQFRESKQSAQTIGAKLGVAHLLEGSVRRAGETVRISAELINASDGSTLWSQHYDRPYKDLFALQDDITQAVATALQARLLEGGGAVAQSERPRSGNLAAYTALLQGRFHDAHNTEGEKREAIAQYQAAVKIDPRYAQAWAELSEALTGQASKYLSGKDAQQTLYESARGGRRCTGAGAEPGGGARRAWRCPAERGLRLGRRGRRIRTRRTTGPERWLKSVQSRLFAGDAGTSRGGGRADPADIGHRPIASQPLPMAVHLPVWTRAS